MWEVENEPYLPYGIVRLCCQYSIEIALVRALDSHPILVTDSGNFHLGDGGASWGYIWDHDVSYRVQSILGQITYPIPQNAKQTFTLGRRKKTTHRY